MMTEENKALKKKKCPRNLVTVVNYFSGKLKHENSCHIFKNTYSHHQATHAEYHAYYVHIIWC